MTNHSKIFVSLALMLGGCAGVPQLYGAASTNPKDANLAPKVKDIIDEISCELVDANGGILLKQKHIVTVLLTIQVDDNLNVTPSFLFTNGLSGQNRVFGLSEGIDVGGARRRVFTTTFHLDSAKLNGYAQQCDERGKKRLYSLRGNLGLSDIVRDGTAAISKLGPIQYVEGDKKPSYGSTVQFVVNRTVTALGPLWTLNTFKGPGGSNGLINGKQLNTDALTITFGPVIDTSARVVARQKLAAEKSIDVATKIVARGVAERNLAAAVQNRRRAEAAARRYSNTKTMNQAALDAQNAEVQAQAAKDNSVAQEALAREELRRAVEQVDAAQAENARDTERAATASESLLTTMVLQGIGAAPR